jgi:APA family basic amino acid/polyamine antiporter
MLKKQLGILDVFSIAAGAMISSGLFVLPGLAFEKAGPAVIIAYALAGVLMVPTLLAVCELATAMPKSGGSYFFVERSLGPLAGTVAGFANWLSIALKATFAMIGIGAMTTLIWPDSDPWLVKVVAAMACLFFACGNIVSVKGTGRLQVALVIGLLIILAIYVFKGFAHIDSTRYSPFAPYGAKSIFTVAGMVFISFGGLTKVVDVAEEVQNGKKNLPLGMLMAFVLVNILYVLIVFVTVGIVEADALSGSLMPITLGGQVAMGKAGLFIVALAAFFAFATTGNAGMLSASRTPMAMSRDGLVPEFLSRQSKRFNTPHFSLIMTFTFMILVIASLSLNELVKTASTIMILMFALMNIAVIIMHFSGIEGYRPTFHVPLKPGLQIVTVIVYLALIAEMGKVPLLLTAGFCFAAILWYLFYVQRRIKRQSALVYMVKNAASEHIGRTGLEEELQKLALERDQIEPDRFDILIKNCIILDIEKSISAKEFFKIASKELSSAVTENTDKLHDLFIERERESHTIVKPGLAIPHIVVQGKNIFQIMLVRCNEGIIFSELEEPVKTAFILVGSPDERNYHLRALMSVAHIVSEPEFESRWSRAKNAEQLRDIVLLSTRNRTQT